MTDNVVKLVPPEAVKVKPCGTCAHQIGGNYPPHWYCRVQGFPVDDERKDWAEPSCGPEGRWWEARQPKAPEKPGFWERLGNLILKKLGEEPESPV